MVRLQHTTEKAKIHSLKTFFWNRLKNVAIFHFTSKYFPINTVLCYFGGFWLEAVVRRKLLAAFVEIFDFETICPVESKKTGISFAETYRFISIHVHNKLLNSQEFKAGWHGHTRRCCPRIGYQEGRHRVRRHQNDVTTNGGNSYLVSVQNKRLCKTWHKCAVHVIHAIDR